MMRNEIGSEYWDIPLSDHQNNVFPYHTQWYLSGRSALKAIIRDLKNCRTVALPSWCCDSVIKPFVDAGIKVYFYSVWYDGALLQDMRFDCDALLVMDYFGYTTTKQELLNYNGIVIRDLTHSLFSSTYDDADYLFGSLRKWCGVWTGGFVWSKDGHTLPMEQIEDNGYTNIREHAMKMKKEYIYGDNLGKEYLEEFNKAEELLEDIGMLPASERDKKLACLINVEYIKEKRRANASVLQEAFPEWLFFSRLDFSDCPLFVPVFIPNNQRDGLRRYLIDQSIYCPVHWPLSKYHNLLSKEREIYENELSLVCDQRYNVEDMTRMVNEIKRYMEE